MLSNMTKKSHFWVSCFAWFPRKLILKHIMIFFICLSSYCYKHIKRHAWGNSGSRDIASIQCPKYQNYATWSTSEPFFVEVEIEIFEINTEYIELFVYKSHLDQLLLHCGQKKKKKMLKLKVLCPDTRFRQNNKCEC